MREAPSPWTADDGLAALAARSTITHARQWHTAPDPLHVREDPPAAYRLAGLAFSATLERQAMTSKNQRKRTKTLTEEMICFIRSQPSLTVIRRGMIEQVLPCDAQESSRVVMALQRQNIIGRAERPHEVRVLGKYADPDCRENEYRVKR